ncbi:hypothetical protein Tco_0534300 [Tanacetum coccineum]
MQDLQPSYYNVDIIFMPNLSQKAETTTDFPEVFPEDLPGLLTTRQVEISDQSGTWCCICGAGALLINAIRNEKVVRATARTIRQRLIKAPSSPPWNKKEHEEHLKRQLLELLKKEELYAKFSKCESWISKVQYLSHVIDSQGIHVDPAKIEFMKDWWSSLKHKWRFELSLIGETKLRSVLPVSNAEVCSVAILALPEGSKYFELLSDYDCEIRYHPGKANIVADALSRKERIKPLRVRALVMTIGLDLPKQILKHRNPKTSRTKM